MQNKHTTFIAKNFNEIAPKMLSLLEPILDNDYATDEYQIGIKDLSQHLFGLTSKKSKKIITSRIFDEHFDMELFNLIRIMSYNLKMDINHIFTFCDAFPVTATPHFFTVPRKTMIKHYKSIASIYDKARMIKLLMTQRDYIVDTAMMISRIKEAHPTLNFLPKKPKDLLQIHDVCVRTLPKVNQEDFDLCQRQDILKLDGVKLHNDLTIRVPRSHFDLIDLGESLSFCIGNGDYSDNVVSQRSSIVAVFDKAGAKWGIEFSRYRILQAHGFSNLSENKPTSLDLHKLSELLTSKPEFQKDFLPITDSGWIHGYKYNNEDLYLLMNGIVYVYFGVPIDVYEELLYSKRNGSYVNQNIKGVYGFERLDEVSA